MPEFDKQDPSLDELDPQEDQQEAPPEPQLVRIRYAGDTYEVPEHLADVWAKREEEFQKRLSEQSGELGRLRQQIRQPDPVQGQTRQVDPNADLEFFQSPSQAIEKHKETLREELRAEMRVQADLQERTRKYWETFYKDNSELVGREELVGAVVNMRFQQLKDLSPEESQTQLAGMVKGLLGSASAADKKTLPTRQATSERASNSPAPTRKPPTEGQPARLGLSAELKARAERRRRAQFQTKD